MLDIMFRETADFRAPRKVVEPVGMTPPELLEWYLEQAPPFRRREQVRILELVSVVGGEQ